MTQVTIDELANNIANMFKVTVENRILSTSPSPVVLGQSPLSAGAVIARDFTLTTTYNQSPTPTGNDFWVDYLSGEISFNNPALPDQLAVTYSYDPAKEAILHALLDVSRALSRSKEVNISIVREVCEYDLPHDFLFAVSLVCDSCVGCDIPLYDCSEGCDGKEYACGKLIFHNCPDFTSICCLRYAAGFLPDENGLVDLPQGYEQAVFLRALAIITGMPNAQATGTSTPSGGLIERTYQIGDERVTRKWDKGATLGELCKKYQGQYETLIARLKRPIGRRGNTARGNRTYHGLRC